MTQVSMTKFQLPHGCGELVVDVAKALGDRDLQQSIAEFQAMEWGAEDIDQAVNKVCAIMSELPSFGHALAVLGRIGAVAVRMLRENDENDITVSQAQAELYAWIAEAVPAENEADDDTAGGDAADDGETIDEALAAAMAEAAQTTKH